MYLGGHNNDMKTQSMIKDGAVTGAKTDTEAARAAAKEQLKKSTVEMRCANFNLGAHLPEHNKYHISNLT